MWKHLSCAFLLLVTVKAASAASNCYECQHISLLAYVGEWSAVQKTQVETFFKKQTQADCSKTDNHVPRNCTEGWTCGTDSGEGAFEFKGGRKLKFGIDARSCFAVSTFPATHTKGQCTSDVATLQKHSTNLLPKMKKRMESAGITELVQIDHEKGKLCTCKGSRCSGSTSTASLVLPQSTLGLLISVAGYLLGRVAERE